MVDYQALVDELKTYRNFYEYFAATRRPSNKFKYHVKSRFKADKLGEILTALGYRCKIQNTGSQFKVIVKW